MEKTIELPDVPVLVEERVVDDRAKKFGTTIIERDFRMPDGNTFSILCVDSTGNGPFVVIFPLTENDTVLLVNQFRFATNEWTIELPGGGLKLGQTWREAAKDELLEEVGADSATMEIIGNPMPINPGLQTTRFVVVLATGCKIIRPQNLDSTEIMVVKEVPLSKFREMLKKGEITDAKTVATGYLALDHLGLLG